MVNDERATFWVDSRIRDWSASRALAIRVTKPWRATSPTC